MFEGKGWTVEQFDTLNSRLIEKLGLAPGQSAPGVMFHRSAQTDSGMRVTDVYQGRQPTGVAESLRS